MLGDFLLFLRFNHDYVSYHEEENRCGFSKCGNFPIRYEVLPHVHLSWLVVLRLIVDMSDKTTQVGAKCFFNFFYVNDAQFS